MRINKLTTAKIAGFQPKARQYTQADGMSLTMIVHPNGGKYWRFRYRFMGIQKMIGCGTYPTVTVTEAREKRDEYRAMLRQGRDPAELRDQLRDERDAIRFSHYANAWVEKFLRTKTVKTRKQAQGRLEKWVTPKIGNYPVPAVTRQTVVKVLRTIEDAGVIETARRVRSLLDRIFENAVNEGLISSNPVPPASTLEKVETNGFAFICDQGRYTRMLKDIARYGGNAIVKYALQFLSLTAVRPGELRLARWNEIDWQNAQWVIPAERTKMRREHIVPLSDPAMDILRVLWQRTGGGTEFIPWRGETRIPNNPATRKRLGDYIFTINGRNPISDGTLNKALRTMGYDKTKHVGHGFRKSFSTIMNERGFNGDDIELQLAHLDKNKIRGIYNKAMRLEARRELMDRWGEYFENGFPD